MPLSLLMFHGWRKYPTMASAIKHAARISRWRTLLMEQREPSDDASGKIYERTASSETRRPNTSPWCIPEDIGDTNVNVTPTLGRLYTVCRTAAEEASVSNTQHTNRFRGHMRLTSSKLQYNANILPYPEHKSSHFTPLNHVTLKP